MNALVLERAQLIARPVAQVFPFFADARNLEAITPPWLHFRVLSPEPIVMEKGAQIAYRIRWRWVPWRWLTEIADWDPPNGFIDRQLQGPYALWHHTHQFQSVGEGTLMIDTVRYRLPFGLIGSAANAWMVRGDLERIFDYRQQAVASILDPAKGDVVRSSEPA